MQSFTFMQTVDLIKKSLFVTYEAMLQNPIGNLATIENHDVLKFNCGVRAFLATARNSVPGEQIGEEDAKMWGMFVVMVYDWLSGSRAWFEVGANLADLLSCTMATGIETSWLKLPYSPMLLTYPPQTIIIEGLGGKPDNIVGVMVQKTQLKSGAMALQITGLSSRNTLLSLTVGIEMGTIDEFADGIEPKNDESYAERRNLLNLVCNTLLYINAGEETPVFQRNQRDRLLAALASKKSNKKLAKIQRALERADPYDKFVLGSNVKIGGPSIQRGGGASGAERCRIFKRFMVRGHWRKQVHGPGNSLRKLIWVKPFYKGPKDAVEIIRKYVVFNQEDSNG